MRVYLAATAEHIGALAADGEATGPWEGFAATPGLRAGLADVGDEDLEFALSVAAGEASAAMSAEGRRFVVVADLDPSDVVPEPDTPGAVAVAVPLRLHQVDSVLAGESDDAEALSWYATQEIADLVVSH